MVKREQQVDAVAMMRRLRDEIDREVEGMTDEQRRAYIRERAAKAARKLNLASSVPAQARVA